MADQTPLETLQALGINATGKAEALGGGDIGKVWRIPTRQGELLVKHADAAGLEAEAEGLETLRKTCTRLIVPEVLGLLDGALVMTYLPPTSPNREMHETFGHGLRELHQHTASHHGWHRDNLAGTTPQLNPKTADGRVFQREQRIMALAARCLDQGSLDYELYDDLNKVAHALESWLPDAPPSLLHGDLWSGNIHFSTQGPALIDPAVYYHYSDVDIALLELFGRPHDAFYEAYWDGQMPGDWSQRRALFQLYPLLNHLYMFGGSYLGSVKSAVAQLPQA